MSHAMLQNFKFYSLFILVALLMGCSSTKKIPSYSGGPLAKTFRHDYDTVWKAAQLSIAKYPLKSYDNETGIIVTDYISGESAWHPPYRKKYGSGGYRYKINIRLLKSKNPKEEKVKVIVLKQVEKKADFFSNFKKFKSNGLEEYSILYRIQREIQIENALKQQ